MNFRWTFFVGALYVGTPTLFQSYILRTSERTDTLNQYSRLQLCFLMTSRHNNFYCFWIGRWALSELIEVSTQYTARWLKSSKVRGTEEWYCCCCCSVLSQSGYGDQWWATSSHTLMTKCHFSFISWSQCIMLLDNKQCTGSICCLKVDLMSKKYAHKVKWLG